MSIRARYFVDLNSNSAWENTEPSEVGSYVQVSCVRDPPTITPTPSGPDPLPATPTLTCGGSGLEANWNLTGVDRNFNGTTLDHFELEWRMYNYDTLLTTRGVPYDLPVTADNAYTVALNAYAPPFNAVAGQRIIGTFIVTLHYVGSGEALESSPVFVSQTCTLGAEPSINTPTSTATPLPATPTSTTTPLPATPTSTTTPLPATPTSTATPLPATPTSTATPLPATPTSTATPLPATPTSTATPVLPTPTDTPTVTLTPIIPPPDAPPALQGGNMVCDPQTSETVITISWDALVPPDGVLVRYEYQFDDPITEDDDYTVTRSLTVTHPGDAAFVATFRVRARYFIDLNDNGSYDAGDLEPSSVGPYLELTCSRPAPTDPPTNTPVRTPTPTQEDAPNLEGFTVTCFHSDGRTTFNFAWDEAPAPNVGTLMYRFFDTAINPPDQRAGTTSFVWSIAGDTEREYVFLAQVVYFIDRNGDGFQQSPSEPFDRSVARVRRCTPMAATMAPTDTPTPTPVDTPTPTVTTTPTVTLTPIIPPPDAPPALQGGNMVCDPQTSETVITISWGRAGTTGRGVGPL